MRVRRREEAGLRSGPLGVLGIWRHRRPYPGGNGVDWTTHVFVVAYAGGEVRADNVSPATAGQFAAPGAQT